MSRNLWAVIACIGLAGGCAAEQVDIEDDGPSGSGDAPATGGGGASAAGAATGGTPSTGGKPATGGTSSTSGGTPAGAAGTTSQGGAGAGGTSAGGAGGSGGKPSGGSGGTPPQPNLNLPFKEDFEDGAANGFIPWNEDMTAGTWTVAADGAGKIYQPSATRSELEFAVGGSSTWSDVAFTVRVRLNDADSGAQVAIRFTAPKTYLFVEMAEGKYKLRGREDGSTQDLVSPSPKPTIVGGTWYTVGITAKGTTVSLTLDGKQIGSAAMASALITKGGVALGVAEGSVSFDDVNVVAAP